MSTSEFIVDKTWENPGTPVDDKRWLRGGFKLELYTNQNNEFALVDITDRVMSLSWSESLESAAVQGSLELFDPMDRTTKNRTLIDIKKGMRLKLSIINEKDQLEEYGRYVIWEKSRGSVNDATLRITFYDSMIYLQKSEDFFMFQKQPKNKKYRKGWTASQITAYVCKRYGIPVEKSLPVAKHKIPFLKIEGGSVYELLLKAWSAERRATGDRFIIRMNKKGRLDIIKKTEQSVIHAVREGENLISSTFTDSLEGMSTAVTVISEAAKTGGTTSTDRDDTGGAYESTGGGWKKVVATYFSPGSDNVTPGDPDGNATGSGKVMSDTLKGYGETSPPPYSGSGPYTQLSTLFGVPSAKGAGGTLIGLAYGTKMEVRWRGRTILIEKVDVGGGGPGIGSVPRGIDLTVASYKELTAGQPDPGGKFVVEARLYGGGGDGDSSTTSTASGSAGTSTGSRKPPAVIATKKNSGRIEKYGYLHKLISREGLSQKGAERAATEALKSTLKENLDATVTATLMPMLRAGSPVYVKDTGSRLDQRFYCSDVRHNISPSGCTTEIGLNWMDVVPSALFTDEERGLVKDKASTNVNSADVKDGIARILPNPLGTNSYGYSDPEGGAGGQHRAHDWFAPAGTPVSAPEGGKVVRIKADPSPGRQASDQVYGGSVYIQSPSGRYWVLRHLQNVIARTGQTVNPGDHVADVKDWSGDDHVHVELYVGGYNYGGDTAQNPWQFFKDRGFS